MPRRDAIIQPPKEEEREAKPDSSLPYFVAKPQ
jgi:hypothetical protein